MDSGDARELLDTIKRLDGQYCNWSVGMAEPSDVNRKLVARSDIKMKWITGLLRSREITISAPIDDFGPSALTAWKIASSRSLSRWHYKFACG